MKRHSLVLSIAIVLPSLVYSGTGLAQFTKPGQTSPLLRPLSSGSSVVHAQVVSVEKVGFRTFLGTLRITKVFAGDPKLVGETFTCRSFNEAGGGNDTFLIEPAFAIGEEGLWMIGGSGGRHPKSWHLFPALPIRDKHYDAALSLARAIEKIDALPLEKRLEAFDPYLQNEVPQIAEWAIECMRASAVGGNGEVAEFLLASAKNPEIAPAAQIALDAALSEVMRSTWDRSPAREKLLQRLVSGKLSDYEADQLFSRLSVIAQANARHARGGIDTSDTLAPEKLFALARSAVANEDLPFKKRWQVRSVVGYSMRSNAGEPEAWKFVLELIRDAKEPQFREYAANALTRFSLDGDRRKEVFELRDHVGESVRQAIDQVLGKAQE